MLTLPYPPSGNHSVKNGRGRHYVPSGVLKYRNQVAWIVQGHRGAKLECRLEVRCVLHMPDHRKRDLDNAWKTTADALTKAGLWKDDSQIDVLLLERGEVSKTGARAIVTVRRI